MRAVPRPPGPRTTTRALRLARTPALAELNALALKAIHEAGKRPWDLRGRPKKNDDDALIEDIEWMLQDSRWLAEGIPHLEQVAARLDLSAERLRKRLTEIGRNDVLAILSRMDAA